MNIHTPVNWQARCSLYRQLTEPHRAVQHLFRRALLRAFLGGTRGLQFAMVEARVAMREFTHDEVAALRVDLLERTVEPWIPLILCGCASVLERFARVPLNDVDAFAREILSMRQTLVDLHHEFDRVPAPCDTHGHRAARVFAPQTLELRVGYVLDAAGTRRRVEMHTSYGARVSFVADVSSGLEIPTEPRRSDTLHRVLFEDLEPSARA